MSKVSQRHAMVSYFNSLLSLEDPKIENQISSAIDSNTHVNKQDVLEPKREVASLSIEKPQVSQVLEREDRREELQTLLDTVPMLAAKAESKTKVGSQVATATATQVKTVEKSVETLAKPKVETENTTLSATATQPKVQPQIENKQEVLWKNLETDKEFTALFFKVAGITLAVPLVNLGGIYEPGTITELFGKPNWFMGIMPLGENKVSVVDTQKWMLPDIESPKDRTYKYVIMLDKTNWCIGCDELIGTKVVSRDAVKWREQPGVRPWLAGIVKDDMCALIHVSELIKIYQQGLDMCKE